MNWLNPRWRKVIRDIWQNKARTVLVVMAIAVGVFAFGGMFITREVLLDNMNTGFAATDPATITVSLSGFDESLVRTARTLPYVEDVNARASAQVQVWNGKSWSTLTLNAAPDFAAATVNTLNLEQGNETPLRREIMLERQSFAKIPDLKLGDSVLVETSDGTQRKLTLSGVVHDFNAVPASRFPFLTGYVSLSTLQLLDLSDSYSELQIVTPPELQTEEQLQDAADVIKDRLERYGYTVFGTSVNEPGQHWASDFIDAVVLALIVLGLLALGLSGFLVINTVTALLAQQKRQIGMMKAIGATTGQVTGIYLATAGVYGALSLLIALPVGVLMANALVHILADFLNIDVASFYAPGWVFALQVATALVIPLLAALLPVLLGSRTTVREAISDYGITRTREGLIDRFLTGLRGVSRPVLISLRNTFRRKGRLILTLVTLAVAGGIFISVLNTRTSVIAEFQQILNMFGYDVQVILTQPQPVGRLSREASTIDGVNRVEGWGFASGTIIRPPGVVAPTIVPTEQSGGPSGGGPPEGFQTNDDEGRTSLTIFAPPLDSPFLDPTVIEGRWLQPGDKNVIVLSSEVLRTEPWIEVGDTLKVDFGERNRELIVVGIVNLEGITFAYSPFDYITRIEGQPGYSQAVMLGTTSRDQQFQEDVARAVEDHFKTIGIGVFQTATPYSLIGVLISLIDFFVAFLLFMAVLLGIVGGLGLASTMSLNVLERTREIGVMRAIGASNGAVRGIFLAEGLLIGAISYAISAILSFPISLGFVILIGNAFFDRPMALRISPTSFLAWLGVALILAAGASIAPANRAASISVRESLAYE